MFTKLVIYVNINSQKQKSFGPGACEGTETGEEIYFY